MSEGEEVRAGRGQRQVVQGLVGHGEDLGLLPRERERNPGGLWAEKGQSSFNF